MRKKIKHLLLKDLVKYLANDVIRIVGVNDNPIEFVESLSGATHSNAITFCNKNSREAIEKISVSVASFVFCSNDVDCVPSNGKVLIFVKNPRLAFIRTIKEFFTQINGNGVVHPTAIIYKGAKIHKTASIGAYSVISGNCSIGEETIIEAHCHLYENVRVGKNVIIYSGAKIGGDGFGYERNEDGTPEKFPHIGGVIIEDNVEIGCGACVDKGTLDNTVIGAGSKIDSSVHIAHNVKIGRNCLITTSLIGGSAKIGDNVWIGSGAVISSGVSVGDNARISLGAIVVRDVNPGITVSGNFAVEHKKFIGKWTNDYFARF